MNHFIDPMAISAFVVHQKRYLLIRRCSSYLKGTWQMVTGRIDPEEKAWEAALREIREETSLVANKLYVVDTVETFYMKSLDKITCVPVFVAFVDSNKVVLSPNEHDAYEWLTYKKAKERLLWAEQKRVLSHIHENFVLKKASNFHLIEITH